MKKGETGPKNAVVFLPCVVGTSIVLHIQSSSLCCHTLLSAVVLLLKVLLQASFCNLFQSSH
jgi:hypothetical protein